MAPDRYTLERALQLVYIVDDEQAGDWRRLDQALEGGLGAVWLRAPGATGAALYRTARDLVRRCHAAGAGVIIGDRADVALATEADGVQLGFRSPPAKRVRGWFPGWIGVSCHSAAELASASRAKADYAVLSPLYGVPDKGAPLGRVGFEKLVADTDLPIVALGGIEPATAPEAREAGAAGVAVIRALRDAEDPRAAAQGLLGHEMTPR